MNEEVLSLAHSPVDEGRVLPPHAAPFSPDLSLQPAHTHPAGEVFTPLVATRLFLGTGAQGLRV